MVYGKIDIRTVIYLSSLFVSVFDEKMLRRLSDMKKLSSLQAPLEQRSPQGD